MALITDILNTIKNARKGKDMRQAIYDGIQQCYKDATGHPDSVAATVKEIAEVSTNLSKETADRKAEVGIERKRIDNLVKANTDNFVEYTADNFLMSCKNDGQKATTNTALNVFKNINSKSENLAKFITVSSNTKIQIKKRGLYSFDCKVEVTGTGADSGRKYASLKINDTQKNEYLMSLVGETDQEFTNFIISLNEGDTISFDGQADNSDTWLTVYLTVNILDYDSKVKLPDYTREIADVRVGTDGTEYETAGQAVREQFKKKEDDISSLKEELSTLIDDNPEYLQAVIDPEGKFIWGIRNDGIVVYGAGIPEQVKEEIESLSEHLLKKIEEFTENTDKKIEDAANELGRIEDSPEFLRVLLDADGKILWGIKKNGEIIYGVGVPEQIRDEIGNVTIKVKELQQGFDKFGLYTDEDGNICQEV